jgi:alpha-tubulin suppressor-like RCC1 family protein
MEDCLQPTTVRGFEGVRVRCVTACWSAAYAIGENGELFSWGRADCGRLGHGDRPDTRDQPFPKRVEALRDVRVCDASAGAYHAVALTENGLVYAWGVNHKRYFG